MRASIQHLVAKRRALGMVAAALMAASLDAAAAGALPALGGSGGGEFESRCPGNTVLVGLALRVGDVVDALHPLCAPPPGVAGTGVSMPWQGGPGGGATQVVCPPDQPMATGLFVHSDGEETRVVDNLLLYCGRGNGARSTAYARPGAAGDLAATQDDTQGCAPGEVAIGVHGRSGIWLDSVGLVCGHAEAPPAPVTVTSIGRAKSRAPSTTTAMRPSHGALFPSARTLAQPATAVGEPVTDERLDRIVPTPAPDRRRISAEGGRRGIAGLLRPAHSVLASVRYPETYGYPQLQDGSAYACGAFHVSAQPASGARPVNPVAITAPARMVLSHGQYRCDYLIQDLPFDVPVLVRVLMADQRAAGSATWLGGSQPVPPVGQRRTIAASSREVVLSDARPADSLSFEMTYSGPP